MSSVPFVLLALVGVPAAGALAPSRASAQALPPHHARVCITGPDHRPLSGFPIGIMGTGGQVALPDTGADGCSTFAVPVHGSGTGPWKLDVGDVQTWKSAVIPVPAAGVTRRIRLRHDGDTSLR